LPEYVIRGSSAEDGTLRLSVGTSIAEAERRLILATLETYQGNREEVAEALGISVRTLYNRLRSYESEGTGRQAQSES